MEEEIWEDVPGYEGYYQVSSIGRVRSLDRTVPWRTNSGQPGTRYLKGALLKPGTGIGENDRYLGVTLTMNGRQEQFGVHCLVLSSFIGPRPSGMLACHNDGNPKNNRLHNLRWDTPKNNSLDMLRHGTSMTGRHYNLGESNGMSKLTKEDVLEIRRLWESGEMNQLEIGEMYSGCICDIVNRKVWKWV